MESAGIDVSGLLTDEDVRTTLAFVETKPDGDRDFSFYRNPGADMMLREDEVRDDIIADAKIFHFGTLSMTNEPVRSATRHAIKVAKENGAILSFDPNIRGAALERHGRCKSADGIRLIRLRYLKNFGQ